MSTRNGDLGYPCPKCGHSEQWKTQKVHQTVKVCGHCGHSPFVDRQIEMEAKGGFPTWLAEVVAKHEAAKENMARADQIVKEKGESKLSLSEMADLRRAVRELDEAQRVLEIAKHVQWFLESPYNEGAVTLHIPELGLMTQFSWGSYDLFAALKKTFAKNS